MIRPVPPRRPARSAAASPTCAPAGWPRRDGLVAEHQALCGAADAAPAGPRDHGSVMPRAGRRRLGRRSPQQAARQWRPRSENRDTPCQFNWRALLMTALGHARLGLARRGASASSSCAADLASGAAARSRRSRRCCGSRSPAATLRAAERLLRESAGADRGGTSTAEAARLDALAALGDREGVEREAEAALALGGLRRSRSRCGRSGWCARTRSCSAQATRQFTANRRRRPRAVAQPLRRSCSADLPHGPPRARRRAGLEGAAGPQRTRRAGRRELIRRPRCGGGCAPAVAAP